MLDGVEKGVSARSGSRVFCRGISKALRRKPRIDAAALSVGRKADAFLGGGRSKSAGIWKRVRSRCTIAMLSAVVTRRSAVVEGRDHIGDQARDSLSVAAVARHAEAHQDEPLGWN